jgi:cytochrome oxidase Cu insertion factor (SCO1/SenC/PrrC family)
VSTAQATRRTRQRIGGVGALLAVCVIALGACGASLPPPPSANQGIVENRAVPDIPLINDHGQPTSLAAFRGKDIVLAPFLTLCQDECPLVTGAFLALQRDVALSGLSSKVAFMEITVDPQRDSPARLLAYSQRFGADWPLLTGSPANLHRLWNYFGVSVQIVPEAKPAKIDWYTGKPLTYDVDHTDGFILINAQGHERFEDANAPNLHGKLSTKLKSLLNAAGLYGLGHPSGPTWTLSDAVAALSWLVGQNITNSAST